jgi:nucleotide-binding universal stress UspA family protein
VAQKILIALDDSENALRCVELAAKSFSADNTIVLFNVMLDTAALCHMESPELTPLFRSQQSAFCTLEDKKRELVMAAMQKAKQVLLSAGFTEKNIEIKVENKKLGVARDILAEADKGYDMIVMGRRGISGLKEFFLGSISQKVFTGAKDISVLIAN